MRIAWRRTVVTLALAAALTTSAAAFHSGGVGHCGGCHVMHLVNGVPVVSPNLLGGRTPTDICLNCHATADGNVWSQTLTNPGGSLPGNWIAGEASGHSVVSLDRGTVADSRYTTSPGGTYPSAKLGCVSCHDPHGTGGTYRLLYGSNSPPSHSDGYEFQFRTPAPDATGIDVSEKPESPTEHNAYRSGMSAWCGNCHGRYHDDSGSSGFEHPIDERIGSEMADIYNRYRGTGFRDGNPLSAYEPAVPVEDSSMTTTTTGPIMSTARGSCVTCHRAHGSSGPSAGRWDFKISVWGEEGVISGSYKIPNPYAMTAGPAQRQLCDKCHGDSGQVTGKPVAPQPRRPRLQAKPLPEVAPLR